MIADMYKARSRTILPHCSESAHRAMLQTMKTQLYADGIGLPKEMAMSIIWHPQIYYFVLITAVSRLNRYRKQWDKMLAGIPKIAYTTRPCSVQDRHWKTKWAGKVEDTNGKTIKKLLKGRFAIMKTSNYGGVILYS